MLHVMVQPNTAMLGLPGQDETYFQLTSRPMGWPTDADIERERIAKAEREIAQMERTCTCHPDEAVTPCARKYASRDCRLSDVARRIRYAADMVGDDELPMQLHALAREIETIVD
jgi:hypothetical protein